MMLEGFKVINLTVGLSSISITQNGLTFNKTSIVKLGCPSHVLLMLNETDKMLAVQVSDEDNENSTPFYKSKKSGFITVRWNNRDLLHTISKMMAWDLAETGYKIDGEYLSEENAIIFNLNNATRISSND